MPHSVLTRLTSSCATAAVAVLMAGAPLQAQVRDTTAVKTGQDTAAADTVPPPKPLHLAGTLTLSGSVGRLSFGAFQAQSVDMSTLDTLGAPVGAPQSFERTLGAGTTTSAFVGLTYWGSERWGARLEGAWARAQVRPSLSRAGQKYRYEHGGTAETESGAFTMLSVTAVGLYRLPLLHPVYTPYALVGAGVRHYGAVSDTALLPAGARVAFSEGRTVFLGLFGLGAFVRLHGDRWLLQIEFQHRLAPTPIPGLGRGQIQRSDSLLIAFPGTAAAGDPSIDTTASTRLSIGVAYALPLRAAKPAPATKQESGTGPPP